MGKAVQPHPQGREGSLLLSSQATHAPFGLPNLPKEHEQCYLFHGWIKGPNKFPGFRKGEGTTLMAGTHAGGL